MQCGTRSQNNVHPRQLNSAAALEQEKVKMKYAANILLCLLLIAGAANSQSQGNRPYSQLEQSASDLESSNVRMQLEREDALRQQAKYEESEFVKRVDNLLTALRDFSSNYNGGKVVDVKKVKEVRKALHDLEKSAWFRSYKDN
jgi:hypothetical protein